MDKSYIPSYWEPIIRKKWESEKLGTTEMHPEAEAFTIILPPPNANGNLHTGHAMYVYEDIMIRYARQQRKVALWLPGADHAGFETQYVYEKHLAKEGKSRFDFDRETLYRNIAEFVALKKGAINEQFRAMGFSLDWAKEQYTLDPNIVAVVHQTFKKLYDDGLIYRSTRLVNYCTKDGTSFSDLEIEHVEREDKLYYIKYGPFVLATTRPETKFGDTGVAVHPNDKRYAQWIGKEITFEGLAGPVQLKVVADTAVDPAFGTGVVKITPAHDMTDWEIGKRHNLPAKQVIGFDGKLTKLAGPYAGMRVKAAREKVVADMQARGLIDHIDDHYVHTVNTCYKCGNVLEPLPLPQWYISVKPLATRAKKLITSGEVQVHPKRFKRVLTRILDDFIDWNISRQIVWGIRIPAFQNTQTGEWCVELDTVKQEKLVASGLWKQDEDTFDTWFSSGQWPFATLMSVASAKYEVNSAQLYAMMANANGMQDKNKNSALSQAFKFFNYFYPTTVMETGYDIARAWVARMLMLGVYVTGKPPFKNVYLHGMVRDGKGQKMSKSKGNVIDPLKLTGQYGTDALRLALIFGTAAGADVNISSEKVVGMRNFVNKVWNIGRFITLMTEPIEGAPLNQKPADAHTLCEKMRKELEKLSQTYTKHMNAFEYAHALNALYEFIWHRFADVYIEKLKNDARAGNTAVQQALSETYTTCITMLAPFAPFVCEAVTQSFPSRKPTNQ